MSLLVFEDMHKSKVAEYIQSSQKIKVASEVNHELLKAKGTETGKFVVMFDEANIK